MSDAKESGKTEATKTRVSNEQILDTLTGLVGTVETMKSELERMKDLTGFRNKPLSPPSKLNHNTDPGPFKNAAPEKK